MNELQIFKHEEFGEIRTVEINGEPWMVGRDIAAALGYSNPRDALARHVDNEDKNTVAIHDGTSGNPNQTIINESGLYSLVLSSKLPGAKRFRRWVTSEVLPAIRQTGGYIQGADELSPDELMARALMVAQKTIEQQRARISEAEAENASMRPKALFADSVAASKTSILIGELAKLLKQNGVETGQKRLFEWMRCNGYLIQREGTDRNMPTQFAMERGLFEIKETVVTHADGHTSISKTPKVTGKGQLYFTNLFLGQKQKGAQADK